MKYVRKVSMKDINRKKAAKIPADIELKMMKNIPFRYEEPADTRPTIEKVWEFLLDLEPKERKNAELIIARFDKNPLAKLNRHFEIVYKGEVLANTNFISLLKAKARIKGGRVILPGHQIFEEILRQNAGALELSYRKIKGKKNDSQWPQIRLWAACLVNIIHHSSLAVF